MHSNTARLSTIVLGSVVSALVLAVPSAFAYETEPSWVVGNHFSASAVGATPTYENGAFDAEKGDLPTIAGGQFGIDSTQCVFSVTEEGLTANRKIIRIDSELDFSDFYYLDDVTNDVVTAIGAIALVTNDTEAASAKWMGLKGGNKWVDLTGADPKLGHYVARIELDYTTTAQPLVRYSISADNGTTFKALKDGTTEWINLKAAEVEMTEVCFVGKTVMSRLNAQLSTTATAQVGDAEYDTILAAMAAAKTSGNEVIIYQNVAVSSSELRGATYDANTYTINQTNNKTFSFTPTQWQVSDETGVATTWTAGTPATLVVSETKPFVASIGTAVYFSVQEAFDAATDGQTVTALRDFVESVTISADKYIRFDMAGHVGTYPMPSPETTGEYSCINAIGSSRLYVFGGAITNMFSKLAGLYREAFRVKGSAQLWLSDVAVTNNTIDGSAAGDVMICDDSARVVISNGFYVGGSYAKGSSQIDVRGGIHHAPGSFEFGPKVKFSGGKLSSTIGFDDQEKSIGSDYQIGDLAVTEKIPYQTAVQLDKPDIVIDREVMKVVKDKSGNPVATTVWTVSDDTVGGVQIADKWMSENTVVGDNAAKQADLQAYTSYKGGATMKKWEAYVLGMKASDAAGGPTVKGVQDNKPSKVSFSILTPESILAAESGCDVKYSVTEYTKPDFSEGEGTESAKVDYTQAAELDAPESGVRYYKLKMFITPKN